MSGEIDAVKYYLLALGLAVEQLFLLQASKLIAHARVELVDGLKVLAQVLEPWSLAQERLFNACSRELRHGRRVLATSFPIHIFLMIYQTFEIGWILVGERVASIGR